MGDDRQRVRRYLEAVLGPVGRSGSLESLPSGDPLDQYARVFGKGTGLETLSTGLETEIPLSALRQNLEAIILPGERPALAIQDDDFGDPPERWTCLAQHRSTLRQAIRAVGRIEIRTASGELFHGTGFLVAKGLLMTNRHVAERFVGGVGGTGLSVLPGCSASVDFKKEYSRPNEARICPIVAPVFVHPLRDMALVRLSGADDLPTLTLSSTLPSLLHERKVAAIGYPELQPDSTLQLQIQVFDGIFERKRLQPGTLMGVEEPGPARPFRALLHDASTLGGSSGSAVIDIESGLVIGLHFEGFYLVANYAVPSWDLAADEGTYNLGLSYAPLPAVPGAETPDLSAEDLGSSVEPQVAPPPPGDTTPTLE